MPPAKTPVPGPPAAAGATALAAGLPDRRPGGRPRRLPGVRQVPGPDQRGVRGRPVLDRPGRARPGRGPFPTRVPRRPSWKIGGRSSSATRTSLALCLGPGRYVAYGQKCSHLACAVVPHLDAGSCTAVSQRILRGRGGQPRRRPAPPALAAGPLEWPTGWCTPPGSSRGPSDRGAVMKPILMPAEGHHLRRHLLRGGPAGRPSWLLTATMNAVMGGDHSVARRPRASVPGREPVAIRRLYPGPGREPSRGGGSVLPAPGRATWAARASNSPWPPGRSPSALPSSAPSRP